MKKLAIFLIISFLGGCTTERQGQQAELNSAINKFCQEYKLTDQNDVRILRALLSLNDFNEPIYNYYSTRRPYKDYYINSGSQSKDYNQQIEQQLEEIRQSNFLQQAQNDWDSMAIQRMNNQLLQQQYEQQRRNLWELQRSKTPSIGKYPGNYP